MEAHELGELLAAADASGGLYHEFLRVPQMSAGIYRIAAGEADPQSPHGEDELYWVLSGQATIRVGDVEQPVRAGTSVYVAAGVEHRFHSIEENLAVLVVFAPAETGG
jgi:mannose-6-phosphate isomerase-like protein (cupin superfamily)